MVPGTAVNQPITVRVTASKSGFTSVNKTSAPTSAVTAGQIIPGTPTISGSAQVGQVLTANTGSWSPNPDTFTYQWKAAGTNITNATNATLTIPADALGKTITVVVTGAKTGYTTVSRESSATATVVAATGTLTTAVPTISGTAAVGELLTANAGTWGPAPVDLTYQWKSAGTNISGATSSVLEIPATSLGQTITVTVTGTKTGYTTASQTSIATAAVVAGTLSAPTPTITGSAVVGSMLTANPGTWGPSPVALTYQWKSNGTNITGATTATLTIPAASLGQTITVVVTGTKTAYTTASKESAATATVTNPIGTLTTSVPTISGTARVDSTLTANAGTWGPAPVDLTYQWKSNGTAISGATATTLVVPAASLGQTITVTVTGTKTGYTTASQTSVATAAVVAGVLTSSTPTITGTAQVGSTLTANAGTWGPTPVTLDLPVEGRRHRHLGCHRIDLPAHRCPGRQDHHRRGHRHQDRLHHRHQGECGHGRRGAGRDRQHLRAGPRDRLDAGQRHRHLPVPSGGRHLDPELPGRRGARGQRQLQLHAGTGGPIRPAVHHLRFAAVQLRPTANGAVLAAVVPLGQQCGRRHTGRAHGRSPVCEPANRVHDGGQRRYGRRVVRLREADDLRHRGRRADPDRCRRLVVPGSDHGDPAMECGRGRDFRRHRHQLSRDHGGTGQEDHRHRDRLGLRLHTTSATSDPTATVPAAQVSGPIPTISGTAAVGATLTAIAGTWTPAPSTWRTSGSRTAQRSPAPPRRH